MIAKLQSATGLDRSELKIAGIVVLGAIMSILDITIVNVAIEDISRSLNSPLSTVQWISTGYLLALAAVIPLSGWASERFGTRRVWMFSVSAFLVGSLLSGLAQNIDQLIAFRVIQGIGGGMLMPVGMSLLAQTAGPARMGRAMGIIGVPMLLGPVFGPIIGGVLVEYLSWQWIFLVNLPIGILALRAAHRVLPRHQHTERVPLDWLGVLLLSPGLATLVFACAQAAERGGLSGLIVLGPLFFGLASITLFVFHSLRHKNPLLDIKLFASGTLRASALTTVFISFAFFGSMILIPLYYQLVDGASALSAGLLLAPQGLGAAAVMPLAGKWADRYGSGRVVLMGLTFMIVGSAMWVVVDANTSGVYLSLSLLLRGIGMGFAMMPAMSAAYSVLTPRQIPRATSLINVLQRVGGAFGTTLYSIYLTTAIHSHVGEGVGISDRVIQQGSPQVLQQLGQSFGATFWLVTITCVLAVIPAIMMLRNPALIHDDETTLKEYNEDADNNLTPNITEAEMLVT